MQNYIDLAKEIMTNGRCVPNRTANKAYSIFGTQLRWDLSKGFPLLTNRSMFWRGIVEELLFFLRGDTDTSMLSKNGVHIWDANTTREFLDARKLDYPEGEMGPGYGFQWRNWGGDYKMTGYLPRGAVEQQELELIKGKGVDQIARIIQTLQTNPYDRRMIVSAWNVDQLEDMALPPCHLLFQFDATDGRLSLQWYQRSVDLPLGLPFNIASYALLTHIIARIVKLPVGDLIFVGGNTHIYENQMEGMHELVTRECRDLPTLTLPEIGSLEDAEKLRFHDVRIKGYRPHGKLDFPFST